MKKLFAIMASMMFTMSACADYKQIIQFNELPQAAQDFVTQYYNTTDIMHIETEQDGLTKDYTVYLNNGTQIDFEHNGELESIDCQRSAVPEGIVPQAINTYVKTNYPNLFIVEYHVEYRRLTVELNNEWELVFDKNGKFLGIDD